MADKKYHFEKLTPVDSINLDIYEDAINYVFENDDIKNVAISGAYSAGKSSVLASYKKKHNDLSFLHISLAHFKSPEQEETKVSESLLEGKILNQLIHQIPADKIPQTNFRVKKKINPKGIIFTAAEIILLFISIIYFSCAGTLKSFTNTLPDNWLKSILLLFTHPYALIVDGLIIVGLISFIIYRLINVQKNRNIFRKLSLQGNEIEIFEESDDSYFDKYLNEVLYLFENADANVIVFEDMDRFNANRIFERLHEVNTLANIQLKKDHKKILCFFYLLRDDIFVSKDRTKFFDYIIPVVPVVDSSNSYDQFISHFKKSGIYEKLDESFLQGLSLYIDDMRLLKNIYNEFLIYYSRLNTIELDCNRMLALIAYKNLFPRDFADLQLNKGFVFTLFNNRDTFIAQEMQQLNLLISKKKNDIEMANNESLETLHELDVVFEEKKPTDYYGRKRALSQEDDIVYQKRKRSLENRLNNQIPAMEKEKSLLEQEVISMQNKQLCEIITRDNIGTIFSIKSTNEIGQETTFNDIKSSEYFDLLKYLIRNGYIDETYADYMTYFYENSLSRIDKTFLRSITDKKAKEYTYQLKNPQLVVSRLRLMDFDQEETLNFNLLTYLLHTVSDTNYIERFIEQLRRTKNFKFIGMYFDTTTEIATYIEYLNQVWPELFLTALNEHTLSEKQLCKYSICSLYYSDNGTIKLINNDNCLSDYISNARDYLAIDNPNIDRLIDCFILLGVSFIGFEYAELDKDLFRAVYDNSLYEINVDNLWLIQKEVLGIKNDKDIFQKNYTILCENSDSAITQYVNQNINEYFDVVLKICNGVICDDENVVVAVLNSSDLSKEHKHSYISSLQTTIESIKEIADSSLWAPLLNADIIKYSEQNVIDCFASIKLDESVIAYINRCDINFDFSKNEYDSKVKEALFDGIVVCNDIDNIKYKQLLVSLEFYYTEFSIADIDEDKVSILIDTGIIRMALKTLKFMRENYPAHISEFIYKNIADYVDIMDSELFSQEELLEILSSDVNDDLKIKLLQFSSDKISVAGMNYSPTICLCILNNNFMVSDLSDLFASFERWDNPIQEKVLEFAINNIASIVDNPNPISEKLKNDLLHSDNLSRDIKIDLFIAMIPTFSDASIKENLTLLDLTDYLKIYDTRSRPKFEINDESEKLLTAFKEKKLIYNYEESSEKEGYYKIIRIKPANKSLPNELL